MRSTIASSTCGQTDPVTSLYSASAASPGTPGGGGGLVMSSIGTTTPSSKVFDAGGATISTGAEPPRKRATSSIGRTVAERPIRCAGVLDAVEPAQRVEAFEAHGEVRSALGGGDRVHLVDDHGVHPRAESRPRGW